MDSSEEVLRVPQRCGGWWSRNWRWLVPGTVLFLIAIGAAIFAAYVSSVNSKPSYRMALAQVKRNRQVIERLGEPIEPTRWIPAGEEDVANDRGEAHWDFEVSGPKGTAHVRAEARRFAREWSLPVLEATFKDNDKRRLETGDSGDAPKFGGPGSGEAPRFHAAGAEEAPKFNAPRGSDRQAPADTPAEGDIKVEIPK